MIALASDGNERRKTHFRRSAPSIPRNLFRARAVY
jgi:hypothetical protein